MPDPTEAEALRALASALVDAEMYKRNRYNQIGDAAGTKWLEETIAESERRVARCRAELAKITKGDVE